VLANVRTTVFSEIESCVSMLFNVYDRLFLCRMVAITMRILATSAHMPGVHPGECRLMFAIATTAMSASEALRHISNQISICE
jgi:hypothetical protein